MSVPALTEAVIYLLVVLIEVLLPTEVVTVDYLQNSVPTMVVSITPVQDSDDDLYLITASPVSTGGARSADAETVSIRIEQSDLYANNYLVFTPGSPPAVLDLTPVRRRLAGVNLELVAGSIIDLTFASATAEASEQADGSGTPEPAGTPATSSIRPPIAGPLHLLIRPPNTVLAAGAEAILLIAR